MFIPNFSTFFLHTPKTLSKPETKSFKTFSTVKLERLHLRKIAKMDKPSTSICDKYIFIVCTKIRYHKYLKTQYQS